MIVFDENVHQQRLMDAVAGWYRGRVLSITTLRPGTLIKDEAIPSLLHRVRQPTFITTNVDDFWRRVPAHPRYSIVGIVLPHEQLHEMPDLLRRLFRLPEFKTKARRMGKVVRVSHRQLQYYEGLADHIIRVRAWIG
jgi:hypothetical protein